MGGAEMTVKALVCRPDGTQRIEEIELPDGWFDTDSEAGEE